MTRVKKKSAALKKKGAAKVGRKLAVRLADDAVIGRAPAKHRHGKLKGVVRRPGEDVRERVLRAALECFGAFGFEGTSTRAVADRAKVTHTLVLYHFHSKGQLWKATMTEALRPYGEIFRENAEKSRKQSARDALATFIEGFIRMSAQTPQLQRMMTIETNQGTSRLDRVMDYFGREHFEFTCDLIRRGQEEGSVRMGDPTSLHFLIIAAGAMPFSISTVYRELTKRDVFSETEVRRNIDFISDIIFL